MISNQLNLSGYNSVYYQFAFMYSFLSLYNITRHI